MEPNLASNLSVLASDIHPPFVSELLTTSEAKDSVPNSRQFLLLEHFASCGNSNQLAFSDTTHPWIDRYLDVEKERRNKRDIKTQSKSSICFLPSGMDTICEHQTIFFFSKVNSMLKPRQQANVIQCDKMRRNLIWQEAN